LESLRSSGLGEFYRLIEMLPAEAY
jgi:hypothetical protein